MTEKEQYDAPVKGELNTTAAVIMQLMGPDAQKEYEKKLWERMPAEIQHSGTKITLPAHPQPMDLDNAIASLQRLRDQENQVMQVFEVVDGYPYDAAVAFVKAMERKYGWTSPVPTPTFFGPKPPQMLTVRVGPYPEDTIQVPVGSYRIPGVSELITAQITNHPQTGKMVFVVASKCKKREQHVLKDLVAMANSIVAKSSIYRGKALRLTVDEHGNLNEGTEPGFLRTDHVVLSDLIFSKEVQEELDQNLFAAIRYGSDFIRHKIPLKHTVLLEGTYGVGKTMVAAATSKVCVENGVTYVFIDKVQGLRPALEFAKRFQPAVVFAEDIDRVTGSRDEHTNDLMNVIDGVIGKDMQVTVVLTTNHVERINVGMIRPGRIDAVISILPPDAEAVERLVRLYARNLLPRDEPLATVGEMLQGQIPAVIREVTERAKRGMVARRAHFLSVGDLEVAARSMKKHLELLNRDRTPTPSAGDRLAQALGEITSGATPVTDAVVGAVREELNTIQRQVDEVDTIVRFTRQGVSELQEAANNDDAKMNGRLPKALTTRLDSITEKLEDIHGHVS